MTGLSDRGGLAFGLDTLLASHHSLDGIRALLSGRYTPSRRCQLASFSSPASRLKGVYQNGVQPPPVKGQGIFFAGVFFIP